MPSRTYKKKTTYRRKSVPASNLSKVTVAEVANAAWSGVKAIKKLINVEIKDYSLIGFTTSTNSSGQLINLSEIPQGDGAGSRDGDSVKPQYFKGNFTVYNHASANLFTQFRVIIFKHKQANGTTPAVTDILETPTCFQLTKRTEEYRFTILYDNCFIMKPPYSGSKDIVNFKVRVPMEGHIKFVTGATTYESGGLYMLLLADQATNTPSLYYNTRLTYTDN